MARESGDRPGSEKKGISRRTLLVGGGAGVGLIVAFALWPRRYRPNVRVKADETLFNAFIKIGKDGRVVALVPQVDLGQGVATALPQIVADELGADWRTIVVEPAPLSPLYANILWAEELSRGSMPEAVGAVRRWAASEVARRDELVMTGGSTSIRAFEPRLREAAAGARALLAMVAARHWNAEWRNLDVHGGAVWQGEESIGFGDLAEAAAGGSIPADLPMREGQQFRLTGEPLPRLDAPAKVDGSALFAADVRIPDMVFASVRCAPPGGTLAGCDTDAANRIHEALMIFQNPEWVGVAATNSWAADRAVAALNPRWEVPTQRPDSRSIEAALARALDNGEARSVYEAGDTDSLIRGEGPTAAYAVALAPSAPPETLTAIARVAAGKAEIWAPTQAPGLARAAAADALGMSEGQVTIYPMLAVGGGYGRKLEMDAIRQAAIMSQQMGRPVQLIWSRLQDIWADRFRPPAVARMDGRLASNGTISAWRARIAAPNAARETAARIGLGTRLFGGAEAAAAGAPPPYAIPHVAVTHALADIGLPTGQWRSGALSYTTFFNECFADELARFARLEPLSFRMQMLGGNPRLARCLTTATALAGWDGGPPGSGMGLAALSAFGSNIATVVEIAVGTDQRIDVLRAVCAVDCGRVVNPELVRQQVEGGLIFGLAAAIGPELLIDQGLPVARSLGDLGLPTLARSPAITVELIASEEAPGGVTELAVPTAAPAIANALHALTGERVRRLPLRIGSGMR
jgi:isoquinoline 1-oxidoreductase subunit beta